MMFKWLDGREAAHVGEALADQFAPAKRQKSTLEELLLRADRDVRTLQLNFYKKARFANSFKWRLIENGVEPDEANAVTQSLILHLAQEQANAAAQTCRARQPRRRRRSAPRPRQRGARRRRLGASRRAL